MLLIRVIVTVALATATLAAAATCWEQAARRYDVPVELLQAIARHESNLNPRARNTNANGSRDIGLMQINAETWLPQLARYGIFEQHLLDPCLNLQVGAWILAGNVARHGYGWEAVGAYNVGCRQLDRAECQRRRARYTAQIARQLLRVADGSSVLAASPPPGIASLNFEAVDQEPRE